MGNGAERYVSRGSHCLPICVYIYIHIPSITYILIDASVVLKMTITEEQKNIVKSTAAVLKENGKEITSIFYKHLFENHPEMLDFFNHTNQKTGTQPLALANILYFAAENIDHLEKLLPAIEAISQKHRALTVRPKHYPIVGKYLVLAISEFLGDKATEELLDAWSAAYTAMANIFIDIEKRLYAELGSDKLEQSFISFNILYKERISDEPIYSFDIERTDGQRLQDYHPGQYITLRVEIDGTYHNRHYSLIHSFNGETYNIIVQQLNNCAPKGMVSNELINNYHEGDTIHVSLPAGTFAIVDDAKHHLFIAEGMGITGLLTMIESLYEQDKSESITLIHSITTEGHVIYFDRMRTCIPEDQYHLLCREPERLSKLLKKNVTADTHVYLCGATSFMNTVMDYLQAFQFPLTQVHINAFQPVFSMIKNAVKDQSVTKSL